MAALFTAAYIFLVVKGKVFVAKQLESLTGRKVVIENLAINYPLNIDIKGLDVEGLAKVEALHVSANIFGFLVGYPVLNNVSLTKPEFTYRRVIPKVIDVDTALNIGPSLGKIKQKYHFRLVVLKLTVKDGTFTFIDDAVGNEGMKISMDNIELKLTNFHYFVPHSEISNFDLSARIPWSSDKEEGRVAFKGWMNLRKKDIKARLNISGIDGVYLFPYYEAWFGGLNLKKSGIEKAKLNFAGDIFGKNNEVTIDGRLELTDIRRKASAEEDKGKAELRAADFFLAFNEGKIVVNFRTKTKMDKPEFKLIDIKMAFEEKAKN